MPAWFFAVAALVSLASVVAGRPWTILIARRSTPREDWDHPLFLEANQVMTLLWAAIFAASGLVVWFGGGWAGLAVTLTNAGLAALSPWLGKRYAAWRDTED